MAGGRAEIIRNDGEIAPCLIGGNGTKHQGDVGLTGLWLAVEIPLIPKRLGTSRSGNKGNCTSRHCARRGWVVHNRGWVTQIHDAKRIHVHRPTRAASEMLECHTSRTVARNETVGLPIPPFGFAAGNIAYPQK